jgi:hypothetical protein
VALRDAIVRHGDAITPERASWLRGELDHYRVAGVVMSRFAATTKGLQGALRKSGFKPVAEVERFRLWTRPVPPGANPH